MEHVYPELRTIAARHLANEKHPGELQPGALVNEAYLRLIDLNRIQWQDRAHFLAMASRIMRELLVDEARKRLSAKRDGGIQVTLSGLSGSNNDPNTDVLALHEALQRLGAIDSQRAHLVELRFFGGLTIEETAEVLNISPATVKRSWAVARGWLYREINKGDTGFPR